jgi:uncharacterized protein YqgC (DUF456 family)
VAREEIETVDMLAFSVQALVALLLLLGLLGTVLPFLPGAPLIFAGILLHAWMTDFSPITGQRLLILLGLAIAAQGLEWLGWALGVKWLGGSLWAVLGSLAGAGVCLFFGLPGLLAGLLVGAIAGELLRSGSLMSSLTAGVGVLVGTMLGFFGRIAMTLSMVALFLWWLWPADGPWSHGPRRTLRAPGGGALPGASRSHSLPSPTPVLRLTPLRPHSESRRWGRIRSAFGRVIQCGVGAAGRRSRPTRSRRASLG